MGYACSALLESTLALPSRASAGGLCGPHCDPGAPQGPGPFGAHGALWGSAHGPRLHGYEVFVPS